MAESEGIRINREGYIFTLKEKNIRGFVHVDHGPSLVCSIFRGMAPSVYAGMKTISWDDLKEAEWSPEKVKSTPIKRGDHYGVKYELGKDFVWPTSKDGR